MIRGHVYTDTVVSSMYKSAWSSLSCWQTAFDKLSITMFMNGITYKLSFMKIISHAHNCLWVQVHTYNDFYKRRKKVKE